MFNLIITIISIALVVVLTATSVYYGGSAFSEGTSDAIAATYINQAQQVQAAATLYEAQEGGVPTDMEVDLRDGGYLSSVPQTPTGADWAIDGEYVSSLADIAATNDTGITLEVCEGINENGSGLVRCELLATDAPTTDAVDPAVVPTATGESAIIFMAF